jgi:hypothetical protein
MDRTLDRGNLTQGANRSGGFDPDQWSQANALFLMLQRTQTGWDAHYNVEGRAHRALLEA